MKVFICLFVVLAFSCSTSDSDSTDSCKPVVFDDSKFSSSDNFGANLIEYTISGSCLSVKLGVSGCDDDHTLEMVSNGSILKTNPPQMTFDFYDENPQLCLAYFTVDRKFDLSKIKELHDGKIIIRFRNNDISFTYVE